MINSIKMVAFGVCVASAFGVRSAHAEDVYVGETPPPAQPAPAWDDYSFYDPNVSTGIGIGINIGGGLMGFERSGFRNLTSDVGGNWSGRLTFGTRTPIALEATYDGTANDIASQFNNTRPSTLIGTTVDGDLRWNLMPHLAFTPYVFGGVGWTRWDIRDNAFRLSSTGINNRDDVMDVPAGAGLTYRYGGFIGEARGTYRFTFFNNLVANPATGGSSFVKSDNWTAQANVGYEF